MSACRKTLVMNIQGSARARSDTSEKLSVIAGKTFCNANMAVIISTSLTDQYWSIRMIRAACLNPQIRLKCFLRQYIRMWEENEWVKKQGRGDERYDYFRDEDTCGFCKQNADKGVYPRVYCSPKIKSNCNDNVLVKIIKSAGKDELWLSLYSAIPGDNNVGELEEIRLSFDNKEDFGFICKEFCDCGYDPSVSLTLPKEETKAIIESIPLIREVNLPPDFGFVKLNIFDGEKSKWLEEYQKKFREIRSVLQQRGKMEKPVFEDEL